MDTQLEEKIQSEIQKRVFDEEEKKHQREGNLVSQEALSEVSGLSRQEIEQIERAVRQEVLQQEQSRKKFLRNSIIAGIVVLVLVVGMLVTQYNHIVSLNEDVQTKWGQVENVYQRRLDLVPNLVNTVKAYAEHEKELIQMLTDARAKAGGVLNLSAESLDAQTLQQFQAAQSELSSALQRIMVLVEDNPSIKTDQNFLALQAQLEGSENRITVERKRFNEAVQTYNSYVKRFPQNIAAGVFGFDQKAYFQAEAGAENAPNVTF